MKKLIFFLFLAIVLASCDTACDPIINPPTPPAVKKFTITGIAGVNGAINPTSCSVEKGGTAIFTIKPDVGYMTSYLKDGNTILPPTDMYTIKDISENDTFNVVFKKDSLLWPLLKITWAQDSVSAFVDGGWLYFGGPYEVVNFTSDGTYSKLLDGKTYSGSWSLDKSKSPTVLVYGGIHWTIEYLNEQKMSIYYTNNQNIVYKYTYHNAGYKN